MVVDSSRDCLFSYLKRIVMAYLFQAALVLTLMQPSLSDGMYRVNAFPAVFKRWPCVSHA